MTNLRLCTTRKFMDRVCQDKNSKTMPERLLANQCIMGNPTNYSAPATRSVSPAARQLLLLHVGINLLGAHALKRVAGACPVGRLCDILLDLLQRTPRPSCAAIGLTARTLLGDLLHMVATSLDTGKTA